MELGEPQFIGDAMAYLCYAYLPIEEELSDPIEPESDYDPFQCFMEIRKHKDYCSVYVI